MLVLYKNEMYSLDMPYRLFEALQASEPDMEVELDQITSSTYKNRTKAKLGDICDYSVARNLNALRNSKRLRDLQKYRKN